MTIKVITEKVSMPKINDRKFRYTCNNGNIDSYWFVYSDNDKKNKLQKGKFDDMAFLCLQLNKNYYLMPVHKI